MTARRRLTHLRAPLGFLAAFWSSVGLLMMHGCSTVHQAAVPASSAGLEVQPVRQGDYYIITDAYRDRYNALIAVYGNKKLEDGAPVFFPPLVKDAGIEPAGPHQWSMTLQAREDMVVMVALKRRGAAP